MVSVSPPSWRASIYALDAVGDTNAINKTPVISVDKLKTLHNIITKAGFIKNCMVLALAIALLWPFISLGFSAAPTAIKPIGNAARPSISRISALTPGKPIPDKLRHQPTTQPIINGLSKICLTNALLLEATLLPKMTKI